MAQGVWRVACTHPSRRARIWGGVVRALPKQKATAGPADRTSVPVPRQFAHEPRPASEGRSGRGGGERPRSKVCVVCCSPSRRRPPSLPCDTRPAASQQKTGPAWKRGQGGHREKKRAVPPLPPPSGDSGAAPLARASSAPSPFLSTHRSLRHSSRPRWATWWASVAGACAGRRVQQSAAHTRRTKTRGWAKGGAQERGSTRRFEAGGAPVAKEPGACG